jgi:hypothetical protein
MGVRWTFGVGVRWTFGGWHLTQYAAPYAVRSGRLVGGTLRSAAPSSTAGIASVHKGDIVGDSLR